MNEPAPQRPEQRPKLPNPLMEPPPQAESSKEADAIESNRPQKSRWPRFSMKMLLLIMTVFSAAMAGYGGMRARKGDWIFSVLLCASTPVLAMLVIGVVEYVRRRR